MNKDTLKGQWKELKGRFQAKWGELTDDDWHKINGDYDALIGALQKNYGYSKEKASQAVDDTLNQ